MKRLELWVVGLTVLTLAGWATWSGSWSVREPMRWSGCIGKAVTDCRLPTGYERVQGCSKWQDCEVEPPAVEALTSPFPNAPKTFWSSSAHALLAIGPDGKILRVSMRRDYAYP